MINRTNKLYQHDVYLREAFCKILEVDGCMLVLDRTPFYPEGGGQPCDLGTIAGQRVVNVTESGDVVRHELEVSEGMPDFHVGDEVHCLIDWDRRFDHMQNHCGEHILSGIFFRMFGGTNRGFRIGSDTITIDIDFRGTPSEGIKAEQLDLAMIELTANEIIWKDAPVSVRYFDTKSEAENLPLRKALAIESDISIVCVGDESAPSDCVACCGTHPSTAGQIGQIKLLRAENYKGMVRIFFKCGKRALMDYQFKHDLVTTLKTRYSAKEDTILSLLAAKEEKAAALRRELKELKKAPSCETMRSMFNNADRA